MKLLFVSNLFPDVREPYRGLDNATLLHHLAAHYDLRVLAVRPALRPGRREFQPRDEDREFAPVYVEARYIPKLGSAFNHSLMARALARPVADLRRRAGFDVALTAWAFPDGCAMSKLAEEQQFPNIVIAQGSDVHQYLRMPLRRRIMRHWLPKSAAIITRSRRLAGLLHECGIEQEKLHPIFNGVDLALFAPGDAATARTRLGLPQDRGIILFVGNFLNIKNPLLLIRAYAELCRGNTSPPILVMIGEGSMEAASRQLAGKLHLSGQIVFAGRKSAAEIADYMRAADVLCLTSRNEGVPNVVLEAFGCGLPVVAPAVGGLPEVLENPCLGELTEPGNAFSTAASLQRVLTSTVDAAAIRKRALGFSWKETVAGYQRVIEGIRRA